MADEERISPEVAPETVDAGAEREKVKAELEEHMPEMAEAFEDKEFMKRLKEKPDLYNKIAGGVLDMPEGRDRQAAIEKSLRSQTLREINSLLKEQGVDTAEEEPGGKYSSLKKALKFYFEDLDFPDAFLEELESKDYQRFSIQAAFVRYGFRGFFQVMLARKWFIDELAKWDGSAAPAEEAEAETPEAPVEAPAEESPEEEKSNNEFIAGQLRTVLAQNKDLFEDGAFDDLDGDDVSEFKKEHADTYDTLFEHRGNITDDGFVAPAYFFAEWYLNGGAADSPGRTVEKPRSGRGPRTAPPTSEETGEFVSEEAEVDGEKTITLDLGGKGSAMEQKTRIEDVVDYTKYPSVKSSRHGDTVFTYDAEKGSYYSEDGERLKIFHGDKLTLLEEKGADEGAPEEAPESELEGFAKIQHDLDAWKARLEEIKGKEEPSEVELATLLGELEKLKAEYQELKESMPREEVTEEFNDLDREIEALTSEIKALMAERVEEVEIEAPGPKVPRNIDDKASETMADWDVSVSGNRLYAAAGRYGDNPNAVSFIDFSGTKKVKIRRTSGGKLKIKVKGTELGTVKIKGESWEMLSKDIDGKYPAAKFEYFKGEEDAEAAPEAALEPEAEDEFTEESFEGKSERKKKLDSIWELEESSLRLVLEKDFPEIDLKVEDKGRRGNNKRLTLSLGGNREVISLRVPSGKKMENYSYQENVSIVLNSEPAIQQPDLYTAARRAAEKLVEKEG